MKTGLRKRHLSLEREHYVLDMRMLGRISLDGGNLCAGG